MEKKAKIIATIGPAISSSGQIKKLITLGVDAFRINFSHETKELRKIVNIKMCVGTLVIFQIKV